MVYAVFLVIATAFLSVHGLCPPKVVARIEAFWNGNPEADIIHKIIGRTTRMSAPSFIKKPSAVSCYSTVVLSDGVTAKDIIAYGTQNNQDINQYKVSQVKPGLIKFSHDNPKDDELLYVISYDSNVLTYYQCQIRDDESYEAFAGTAVVNVNPSEINNADIDDALTRGNWNLYTLALEPLQTLNVDCPTTVN